MKMSLISPRGYTLPLTDNEMFFLTNVDAQTAASTDLSTIVSGGSDGDIVNSSRTQPRTIILDLRINPSVNVEQAKRDILHVVKIKQQISLKWEQELRSLIISGVVESIDMPRWNEAVTMQITLHCSMPFWEDVDEVMQEINVHNDLHYFTNEPAGMLYFPEDGIPLGEYDKQRKKTFYNAGDVAVGMDIIINALGKVTNPIIYDTYGNYFGVGVPGARRVIMNAGDTVRISTHRGNKRVEMNGVNLYGNIKDGSKWLQLEPGHNQFSIDSDNDGYENMSFIINYKQRYI